ncbi:MAG: transporter substrate-binding domain-containing protein [Venatoribacter sp.]
MRKLVVFALLLSSSVAFAECSLLLGSSNAEYPPYLWRSADSSATKLEGAAALFMQRIGEDIGLSIHTVYVGPWGRTQEEIFSGNLDLMTGGFFNEKRATQVDYLYPAFLTTRSVVWINKNNPFVLNSYKDLIGRTGVTVINNSFGQEFDHYAKANLRIFEVGSISQGFRMLEDERVDYLVYEEAPAEAYITQYQFKNLKKLEPPVSKEKLYLAISKKSKCNTPELRQKLEQALLKAQQNHWAEQALKKAEAQWQALHATP